MKKLCALLMLAMLLVLSGCAGMYRTPAVPSLGLLYADIQAPLDVDLDDSDLGTKKGTSTSASILGLIATGDSSVRAAANSGGITNIKHADYKFKNILGVYSEFTTVVYGD